MKKMLITSLLVIAGYAHAEPEPLKNLENMAAPELRLSLMNHKTSVMDQVTILDTINSEKMSNYVAALPGAVELYQTYVSNGYIPMHAMLLSNWDVTEAIRSFDPKIPQDPMLKDKILQIKSSYTKL